MNEQNFTIIVSAPLRYILSGPTLSVGIVSIFFLSPGTGKYAQIHWAFKLPLRTFSGTLETFPMVTIRFLD